MSRPDDRSWLRRGLVLGSLAAGWALPGGVLAFHLYHGRNRLGVSMHSVMLLDLLLMLLLPFFFHAIRHTARRGTRIALAVVLGSAHFGLLLLYTVMMASRRAWGSLPTWPLLKVYVVQIPLLFHQFGMVVILACVAIAVSWIVWMALFYWLGPILLDAIYADETERVGRGKQRVLVAWGITAWLLVSALSYFVMRNQWHQREMVHRMFYLDGQSFFVFVPEEMLQVGSPEPRKTYTTYPGSGVPPVPTRLILVTIDALRSDQMNVYGAAVDDTPFLSQMVRAGKMQRIDSAYSVCTLSYCGLLGILTSSYRHELRAFASTLPDVVQQRGYQSRMLMGGDHRHFYQLSRFFGKNLTQYTDGVDSPPELLNDDQGPLSWFNQVPWSKAEPMFVQVHLMSVHLLGVRRPEYQHWQPSRLTAASLVSPKELDGIYKNNYWNGILQADDVLRKMFATLEAKGELQHSLIIVTADHGEYLGEDGWHGHGGLPYEPVLRIPLLIYDPSGRQYPQRALTSLVDIAPTFLYAIGAPVPSWWSGIPLQMETTRDAITVETAESSGVVVQVGERRYKYLRDVRTHREEAFELGAGTEPAGNLVQQPQAKPLVDMLRRRYEEMQVQTGPGRIR